MKSLQFYRYLVGLISTQGVQSAIGIFQALLRQGPLLLHYLKLGTWDAPATTVLNVEKIEQHSTYTELDLHCALMNLMQQVERYYRLNPDTKASFQPLPFRQTFRTN